MAESANIYNFSSKYNATSTTGFNLKLSPLNITLLVCYSLIFTLGVCGNLLVVKWFYEQYKQKMAGSALVMVLAVNDLLASIIVPLTQIHYIISLNTQPKRAWYLGRMLCYTMRGFGILFLLATSWILIAIASERYKWVNNYMYRTFVNLW